MFDIITDRVEKQIAENGRAWVKYTVEGCENGVVGPVAIEITFEGYPEKELVIRVHTNFAPVAGFGVGYAMANWAGAVEHASRVVAYWENPENYPLIEDALEAFNNGILAEEEARKEREFNDTSLLYTADKILDELAEKAKGTSVMVDMNVRYRGEKTGFTIGAKRTKDYKVRFYRYGYSIPRKEAWKMLVDRGAEVTGYI